MATTRRVLTAFLLVAAVVGRSQAVEEGEEEKESWWSLKTLIPRVEVTLANDGEYPVWYMCQKTDASDSLHELLPNGTFFFNFSHVAFPMRWCYLYVNDRNYGFFWAYTVRNRCIKCFWSINNHPNLYRNDKGRWERQKLFMPSDFKLDEVIYNVTAAQPLT